jgi:adenylate cyclase
MEIHNDNQCAIMFADIAGSTRLYNQLGDSLAELLISTRLTTMQAIAAKHHGRIVKTIGDEIMCQFPSAEDAALAASEMHIEKNTGGDISALEIRIGLHFGSTISKDGDIYGDAVNIAARMSAIAKANQTITTETFITLLSNTLKTKTRLFDTTRIKGIDEEIKIYQVLWEENNVTAFATAQHIQQIALANVSIVFKFNNEERYYTDSEFSAPISIGRDDSCDIAVEAIYASRSHLNLEFRRGKFVLVDHSTNGTYVKFNHQDEIFIRREELPLLGEGYICLGEIYKQGNAGNIYFSVLQKQ